MNDFLCFTHPVQISDWMGVDFFDSSDAGCTFAAARI
jgi:hypothetical protein